jgi:hypothetical protein
MYNVKQIDGLQYIIELQKIVYAYNLQSAGVDKHDQSHCFRNKHSTHTTPIVILKTYFYIQLKKPRKSLMTYSMVSSSF